MALRFSCFCLIIEIDGDACCVSFQLHVYTCKLLWVEIARSNWNSNYTHPSELFEDDLYRFFHLAWPTLQRWKSVAVLLVSVICYADIKQCHGVSRYVSGF